MEVQGALELPAEANPLSEGLLFHVLRSAASSDPHQIQTGTKQLQKWESEEGYYPLLQVRWPLLLSTANSQAYLFCAVSSSNLALAAPCRYTHMTTNPNLILETQLTECLVCLHR